MKHLVTAAVVAVLLSACAPFTFTVRPAAPDLKPHNSQYNGRLGGDPVVDPLAAAAAPAPAAETKSHDKDGKAGGHRH